MDIRIEEGWKKALSHEWEEPYFKELTAFVGERYRNARIYPPGSRIFAAFDECPFNNVKVVILGQDPYHGPGQVKEIQSDTGAPMPDNGDLSRWASQGVLLLNATLTVEEHRAGSHQGKGWETFTDHVISTLSQQRDNLVFILWGSYAKSKSALIDHQRHMVLTSPHPSPLSAHRGFFGNHHFSTANAYLASHGRTPIIW